MKGRYNRGYGRTGTHMSNHGIAKNAPDPIAGPEVGFERLHAFSRNCVLVRRRPVMSHTTTLSSLFGT